MKKMISSAMVMAITLGSTLFAALPPLGQSAREIDAILVSQELYQKLDAAGQIKIVKRIRDNSYLIITTNQKIKVDVVYDKSKAGAQGSAQSSAQSSVGPQQFKLVFHDAVPLDDDDDDRDDD